MRLSRIILDFHFIYRYNFCIQHDYHLRKVGLNPVRLSHYVYLKNTADFSIPDFEEYCAKLGLRITVHPDFDFQKDSFFLSMRLMDDRFGGSGDFLSGFALRTMQCPRPEPEKKPSQPIELTDFEQAVRGARFLLNLRCCGRDSLEVLMVYVFGAYLVTHMGGVFVEDRTGIYYTVTAPMETAIEKNITRLQEASAAGHLSVLDFTGWP